MVVNLSRAPVTESIVASEVLSTFLCSAGSGSSCVDCHPTCTTCTDGLCDGCRSSGYMKGKTAALCVPKACDDSCGTCTAYDDKEKCTSCKITGATLSDPAGGSCSCLNGFVIRTTRQMHAFPAIPAAPTVSTLVRKAA